MKGYQPRWTKTFLSAVSRVQRHLAQNGFTCPAPLAGPAPLGLGMATVETLSSKEARDVPSTGPENSPKDSETILHGPPIPATRTKSTIQEH
jgi:hypothetical protein